MSKGPSSSKTLSEQEAEVSQRPMQEIVSRTKVWPPVTNTADTLNKKRMVVGGRETTEWVREV